MARESRSFDASLLSIRFRNLIKERDIRYNFFLYRNVFIGSEAVKKMIQVGMAKDEEEALSMGNILFDRGLFAHCVDDHRFKNEYLFYKFKDHFSQYLQQLGEGFWHIRGNFKILKGVLDLKTQMAIVQLHDKNFIFLDCCDVLPIVKRQIDTLVGDRLVGVLNLHPFHTMFIRKFRNWYPEVPFYGCPRHLKKFPEYNWVGDCSKPEIQRRFEPSLQLRTCGEDAGLQFVDPKPPETNHSASVFAFHEPSQFLVVDDTLCVYEDTGMILSLAGVKENRIFWHTALFNQALLPHPTSGILFRQFIQLIINDWDFKHLAAAHGSCLMNEAKERLITLMDVSETKFQEWAETCEEKLAKEKEEAKAKEEN